LQEWLSSVELARHAATALRRVWTIVVWNMVVADILEPVDLGRILKQPQCNTVHGRIAPALVEEPARAIEMVEVVLIRLAAPEIEIRNLKVTPEMASAVAMCLFVVVGSRFAVDEPPHSVVLVQVFRVCSEKFQRLEPEGRDAFRGVVEVDVEAVGLVVVRHVAEDVVVDVAEELDLWLHAPVVFCVRERGMVVEHAGVPAAHLVVGFEVGVLDVVLLEDAHRFFEEVARDPRRRRPVLGWDGVVRAICFGLGLGELLELFGEGHVVEEGPGVVELVVPCSFEVAHRRKEVEEFLVAHEGEEGSVYARGVGVVGTVVVGAPEWFRGLANGCSRSVGEVVSKRSLDLRSSRGSRSMFWMISPFCPPGFSITGGGLRKR
jgi:hypothetical protein